MGKRIIPNRRTAPMGYARTADPGAISHSPLSDSETQLDQFPHLSREQVESARLTAAEHALERGDSPALLRESLEALGLLPDQVRESRFIDWNGEAELADLDAEV